MSSRQVRWAQELSRYHFRIDYRQGKANEVADALSCFPQKNQAKEDKLQTENTWILHKLQSSLTNTNLSGFSTPAKLLPHQRVFICSTHVLPQLRQFWDTIRAKLGAEGLYQASIGAMRLRLSELQESDDEARKIRAKGLKNDYEKVDGVLHHQGLPFVPEAIRIELISWHHDNPLVGHFGVDKTRELVGQKYYWPSLRKDVKSYVKGCDVCLTSKTVRHKPYEDLQSLFVLTYRWKDLSMDFVTGLSLSVD